MSLALLKKLLDDPLVTERTPRCNVYFVMTEPLLTPHLPEMLRAAKERGHAVFLTTNGLLLEKRAAEIAPYIDNIQISLDGPEAVHDAIRGPGFFRAALKGLQAIRALRPDVELVINTTIFNRTAPTLTELASILDDLGVRIDMFKVQGLDYVSGPMQARHNACYPKIEQSASTEGDVLDFDAIDFDDLARQLSELRDWKPRNIDSIGFKPPFTSADELRSYYTENGDKHESWHTCLTPFVAMAVNTAGECFFHIRCFNGYQLGNASTQPLAAIFHGHKANDFRRQLTESDFCFPACTRCCGVNPVDRV